MSNSPLLSQSEKDFEDNYELCFKEPKELVEYFNTLEENNLKQILENQEE